MFRLASLLALFSVTAIGCVGSSDPVAKKPTADSPSSPELEGFKVGEPITHENLTIFPVSSIQPKNEDRFITLDEGLKSGEVEVLEIGAAADETDPAVPQQPAPNPPPSQIDSPNEPRAQPAAEPSTEPPAEPSCEEEVPSDDVAVPEDVTEDNPTDNSPNPPLNDLDQGDIPLIEYEYLVLGADNAVNTLMVVNNSDKPLYLMPGEIIVGGSQDRTIGRELVIKPDGKPVPIDVFCVEHGRWNQRDEQETATYLANAAITGQSIAIAEDSADLEEVAMQANSGKFVATVGLVDKRTRLAVQLDNDQSKVWEQVAVANTTAGVENDSGTFTANYGEVGNLRRLEPYIANIESAVMNTENVVGVIVAINGEVDSMDIYQSTPLFKKLWPKLLKAHALDAANATIPDGADMICTRDEACRFVHDVATAKTDEPSIDGGLVLATRSEGSQRNLAVGAFNDLDASESAPAAFGGAIHQSALAH